MGKSAASTSPGSRAHQELGQQLGITFYQVGVSGRRNVLERIEDKRARRYGSVLMNLDALKPP